MCRCPERDKLRSLPRTPTPHGSPPADAGALGAAEALLPFVAFVRPRQSTRGHYRGRCNLPATMRKQGRAQRSAPENRWYSAVSCRAPSGCEKKPTAPPLQKPSSLPTLPRREMDSNHWSHEKRLFETTLIDLRPLHLRGKQLTSPKGRNWFATDSPREGGGFKLQVPRQIGNALRRRR
jgi:hypothetical protein